MLAWFETNEKPVPESAYSRLASKYFNEGDKKKAFEIAKDCGNKFPESSYAIIILE